MEEGSDRINDKIFCPHFHSVEEPLLNTGTLHHLRHCRVPHVGAQLQKAVSLP